jgi:hypothetical protein
MRRTTSPATSLDAASARRCVASTSGRSECACGPLTVAAGSVGASEPMLNVPPVFPTGSTLWSVRPWSPVRTSVDAAFARRWVTSTSGRSECACGPLTVAAGSVGASEPLWVPPLGNSYLVRRGTSVPRGSSGRKPSPGAARSASTAEGLPVSLSSEGTPSRSAACSTSAAKGRPVSRSSEGTASRSAARSTSAAKSLPVSRSSELTPDPCSGNCGAASARSRLSLAWRLLKITLAAGGSAVAFGTTESTSAPTSGTRGGWRRRASHGLVLPTRLFQLTRTSMSARGQKQSRFRDGRAGGHRLHPGNFLGSELPDLPRPHPRDRDSALGRPEQPEHWMADGGAEALDQMRTALPHLEHQPGVALGGFESLGPKSPCWSILEPYSLAEPLQRLLRGRPLHLHEIGAPNLEAGMQQSVCSRAVIGEQQRPFGIPIQPPYREDPHRNLPEKLRHRGASFGIGERGHNPGRLVQKVPGGRLRRGHQRAVHRHQIARLDFGAQLGDALVVDLHPPRGDEPLGVSSGGHARPGQELLQPLAHPPGSSRSPPVG